MRWPWSSHEDRWWKVQDKAPTLAELLDRKVALSQPMTSGQRVLETPVSTVTEVAKSGRDTRKVTPHNQPLPRTREHIISDLRKLQAEAENMDEDLAAGLASLLLILDRGLMPKSPEAIEEEEDGGWVC